MARTSGYALYHKGSPTGAGFSRRYTSHRSPDLNIKVLTGSDSWIDQTQYVEEVNQTLEE